MDQAFKLNNLTAIIDYNNLQGLGKSNKIINLEPLDKKFKSFGWDAIKVDGHNFNELKKALIKKNINKPKIIIAKTVKGMGISSMQNKLSSHYQTINSALQLEKFLKELK